MKIGKDKEREKKIIGGETRLQLHLVEEKVIQNNGANDQMSKPVNQALSEPFLGPSFPSSGSYLDLPQFALPCPPSLFAGPGALSLRKEESSGNSPTVIGTPKSLEVAHPYLKNIYIFLFYFLDTNSLVGLDRDFYKDLSTHSSYSKSKSRHGGLGKITRIGVVVVLRDGDLSYRRIDPRTY